MISKIVHISDVHFRNLQRHLEYRAVCDNFLYQMTTINPDRIVIAGDLVHSRNQITPELVSEVSWFLSECANVCGKLIIIPGNHDIVEQNKERMDALTPIINLIDSKKINYYTKSDINIDENVAWVVYSIYDNNETPEATFVQQHNDKIKIGLYHGIINGAVDNKGFTFTYGADVEKFNYCDLVLCGDIHKRQVFKTKEGCTIIMPGSFIQQEHTETISEHGYNLINIEGDTITYSFVDIENPVRYIKFLVKDFSDIEKGREILLNA